jgi:predicted DNA-binding protein
MRKRRYERPIGVLLSEETYQKLVHVTDNEEIAISKYIREIVDEKLSQVEKEEEINE